MPNSVFIQRSRVETVIYTLSDESLQASCKHLGRKLERHFNLRSLDPAYAIQRVRLYRVLYFALAGVILCASCLWFAVHSNWVPEGARLLLSYAPGLGLLSFLALAVIYTPKIEVLTFKNHWGKTEFSVFREQKQLTECDAFIAKLLAGIARVQKRGVEGIQYPERFDRLEGIPPGVAIKAKLSIAFGAAATLLPWVPQLSSSPDGLFIGVFGFSVGALLLAFLTMSNREHGRWWSLIGVVLGLIPVFLYT